MDRKLLIAIVIIIVLAGAGYLFVTRTKAGEQALSTLPGRSDASAGSPGAHLEIQVRRVELEVDLLVQAIDHLVAQHGGLLDHRFGPPKVGAA